MADITPGPYIHIGGDEVETIKKSEYIYFINRVQGIVASLGKQMIGWEEISDADLYESTIVQSMGILSCNFSFTFLLGTNRYKIKRR